MLHDSNTLLAQKQLYNLYILYPMNMTFRSDNRSHLKNRILVQGPGESEIQPAGILNYSEELKRGPNTGIGPKDIFEMASG